MQFNPLRRFMPFRSRDSWWVKIHTTEPQCVYYFGPFDDVKEAKNHQIGYIEDLVQEGAQGLHVTTQKVNPKELTIIGTP